LCTGRYYVLILISSQKEKPSHSYRFDDGKGEN